MSWQSCCNAKTDLAQNCKYGFVLWGAPSSPRILPVQVQPIKAIGAQELDGRLDESLAIGSSRSHDGEPGRWEAAGIKE